MVECDAAADLGKIQQAAGELGGELQKARDLGRFRQRGNVRNIPFNNGFDIGAVPILPIWESRNG